MARTATLASSFDLGDAEAELHIRARIENLAPIVLAPRSIEAGCASSAGTPVRLIGEVIDLDGPQDVFLRGWSRGEASPVFPGEPVGFNTADVVALAPLGTTRFTFHARDRRLLRASTVTLITVTNAPPTAVLDVPRTVECTTHAGGIVHLSAARTTDPDGTDPFDAVWHLGDDQGIIIATGVEADVLLPLGTHRITAVVDDPCGKHDTEETSVSVVDSVPPEIADFVYAGPTCLWPPNHRYAVLELERDFAATIADACDPDPALVLAEAVSDEADDGLGDGDTANDVVLSGETVCLRAERQGTGDGRTYTVGLVARDFSGNESDPSVPIVVPRDQRGLHRCREIAPDTAGDGDVRCVGDTIESRRAEGSAETYGRRSAARDHDGVIAQDHDQGDSNGPHGCSSAASTAAPSLLLLIALVPLTSRRARRHSRSVLVGATLMSGCMQQPTPTSYSGGLPAIEAGAAPSGTVEGRTFNATSLTADINERGAFVLLASEFPVRCDWFSPPQDALAGRPRKVIIVVDEQHLRVGTLNIEFPDVQEASASVTLYEPDGTARSVIVRRGAIRIDSLSEGRARGGLSLLETSTDVRVAGEFDTPICGEQ